MQIKLKSLIVPVIAGALLVGCASGYYSQVPEPFTSNFETQQIDNENYQDKLQNLVDKNFKKAEVKIVTNHFNVLIVGEVESSGTKVALNQFIKHQQNTKKIFDYSIVNPKPSLHTSSFLASDIRDRLAQEPDISVDNMSITVVSGVAYLMGTNVGNLTHLDRAIKGVDAIDGVKQVVNLVQPGVYDYNLDQE